MAAPQVLVLFTNKGGVGKTTTTLQLAHALARSGESVLVYDCDSQRNLTQSMLADELKKDKGDLEATTMRLVPKDQLGSFYEQFTAARYFRPIPSTKRKRLDEEVPDDQSTTPDYAAFAHKINVPKGELFLVQGHMETYKLDGTIQIAEALKVLGYANYEAARVRSLVLATAARYKCKFVLMDLSPNPGPLNRYLVWNADFLLIPCMPDYYSCETLGHFARLASEWQKEIEDNRNAMLAAGQPIKHHPPKLLGIVLSLFLDQKKQEWMDKVVERAEALANCQELKEWLPKSRADGSSMILARIPPLGDKREEEVEQIYDTLLADIRKWIAAMTEEGSSKK